MKPSVAVVGAGAVGAFYGAKLQNAGHKVDYQSRQSALDDIERLKISSIWGDFEVDARFAASTSEMPEADIIIVASKAFPSIDLEERIRPLLKPGSIVLLLQNGINQEEKLCAALENVPIAGGLAFTCINRETGGRIEHIDYGLIRTGPARPEFADATIRLTGFMKDAGIETEYSDNLRLLRWQKLLWNIPYNGLSVLCLLSDTSRLMADVGIIELSRILMHEVRQLAAAEGLTIDDYEIEAMIERTRNMKPYKTSMLLDYQAGKKLEVEAIYGEPVRIAEKLGVQANALKTFYHLLSFYNNQLNN